MVKLCLSEHSLCAPHCMEGVPVSWEGPPEHKVCALVSSFPKTVLENWVRMDGRPRLLPMQSKRNDCLFSKQPQRLVAPRNPVQRPERCGGPAMTGRAEVPCQGLMRRGTGQVLAMSRRNGSLDHPAGKFWRPIKVEPNEQWALQGRASGCCN